jgi:hypothetical protein
MRIYLAYYSTNVSITLNFIYLIVGAFKKYKTTKPFVTKYCQQPQYDDWFSFYFVHIHFVIYSKLYTFCLRFITTNYFSCMDALRDSLNR